MKRILGLELEYGASGSCEFLISFTKISLHVTEYMSVNHNCKLYRRTNCEKHNLELLIDSCSRMTSLHWSV